MLITNVINFFCFENNRDLIKITAQYVSRNGPNFHMALLHKEAKNPQVCNFFYLKLV